MAQELPDKQNDPRVGVLIPVTDDMVLVYLQRSMRADVFAYRATPTQQRCAAKIVLRMKAARRKLRIPMLSHRCSYFY